MKSKSFLEFLPTNFRHEKFFLIQSKFYDFESLSNLSDKEINEIQKMYPLCTLNNLKKIRTIAIFKKEIGISPPEAYLLLHCGISSIKSLSQLTPSELENKIRTMELKSIVSTSELSAKDLFRKLSVVKNFEKIIPNNISKFDVLSSDSFIFGIKGMPIFQLKIIEKIESSVPIGVRSLR